MSYLKTCQKYLWNYMFIVHILKMQWLCFETKCLQSEKRALGNLESGFGMRYTVMLLKKKHESIGIDHFSMPAGLMFFKLIHPLPPSSTCWITHECLFFSTLLFLHPLFWSHNQLSCMREITNQNFNPSPVWIRHGLLKGPCTDCFVDPILPYWKETCWKIIRK